MSCSRPSADIRGLSLIEVMVSQSIAIVVISAMMAIVVAMVNKLQSEVAVSDANVALRQVSHLLLRDTQGIGSSSGATAGDFILIGDGGSTGPDTFTIFRRDESICGGSLPVKDSNGVVLRLDDVGNPPTCPFKFPASCDPGEVEDRTLMVLGKTGQAVMMTANTANAASCGVNYPNGKQAGDVLAVYNATYDPDVGNINNLFNQMVPIQILAGSGFTYRLDSKRNVLQRSTNGGVSFTDILDGVFDLQVQRVFQKDSTTHFISEGQALPADVTRDDFIGLRIGLVTFGRAVDGLNVPPPARFANRDLSSAPKNRRYRASFILTAARNRSGA